MAPPRLLSTLLPLESVKLGRLTQNPKRPHSNFIDPLEGRPEAAECQQAHQIDYHETIKFSNGSKLQARLGDIFSFAFKRLDAGSAVVSAPRAANYDLQNSEAWFASACKQEATQKFLQRAHFSNKKVYIVIGYRTVSDAKIEGDKAWARGSETDFEVPASFLQAGMVATSVATNSLAPGTGHTWGVKGSQKNSFQASGEQVFAILYLKVKFKWHSKRVSENATLGSSNRWVPFWDWRGEEDGGNDDGDDLIEAILTDSSDTDDADDESDSDEYDSDEEPYSSSDGPSSTIDDTESHGNANTIIGIHEEEKQSRTEVTNKQPKHQDEPETPTYSPSNSPKNDAKNAPGAPEVIKLESKVVDTENEGLKDMTTLGIDPQEAHEASQAVADETRHKDISKERSNSITLFSLIVFLWFCGGLLAWVWMGSS